MANNLAVSAFLIRKKLRQPSVNRPQRVSVNLSDFLVCMVFGSNNALNCLTN